MKSSRIVVVSAGVVALAVGLGWWLMRSSALPTAPVAAHNAVPTAHPVTVANSVGLHPAPETVQPVMVAPPQAANWYQWSESQRLDFVTHCQHDPNFPPELLAFFKQVIRDRSLRPVTRNNMANCLVGQDVQDPTLAELFRSMALDRTEGEVWRDYALQFMGASIDWATDRPMIAATIWDMAQQESGSIAGTALIHLHYIAERKIAALPKCGNFFRNLFSKPKWIMDG